MKNIFYIDVLDITVEDYIMAQLLIKLNEPIMIINSEHGIT